MTKITTTFTVTNTTTYKTTTVKGFVLNGILHAEAMDLAEAQGATAGNPNHELFPGHLNNHMDIVAHYNGNRVQFARISEAGVYLAVIDTQASPGFCSGMDHHWNRVPVTGTRVGG